MFLIIIKESNEWNSAVKKLNFKKKSIKNTEKSVIFLSIRIS